MKYLSYKTFQITLITLALFASFSSCKEENIFVSKSVVDSIILANNPPISNVAVVFENDIYYLKDLDKPGVRVTSTPSQSKRSVKLSHQGDKFAYLTASNSIIIVGIDGTIIQNIAQYNDIKNFDWSIDDKTLYIVNGESFAFYGPAMNLPTITKTNTGFLASGIEVVSAAVSSKGDIAYILKGFTQYGYRYQLVMKAANSTTPLTYMDESDQYSPMAYLSFSSNEQDLVVGYNSQNSYTNILTKFRVFTGLKKYPSFSFENTSQRYSTPIYNAAKDYIVTGSEISSENLFVIRAIGFNRFEEKSKTNIQYNRKNDALYIDWK